MIETETYPPVDTSQRAFTLRAVLTGALLGAILSICNVYSGLKIGWGFNMSIVAGLLSFGLWGVLSRVFGLGKWTILENNVNQTGASAAASISSAGLVSAVPALTMLSGYQWSWPGLTVWVLCCSCLGVFVAMLMRDRMLIQDKLPFASGVVTARTLQEMYAHGAEGMARVKALVAGAVGAAAWKVTSTLAELSPTGLGWLRMAPRGAVEKAGAAGVTAHNLTFAFDPSLLMVGAGAIIGLRAGVSMLLGAILAWGVIGQQLLAEGIAAPARNKAGAIVADAFWNKGIGEWLLWPGVALLVTSSLASIAFSLPQILRAFSGGKGPKVVDPHAVPPRWIAIGVGLCTLAIVISGHLLFGMHPLIAVAAVLLTAVLGVVALRVSGETNVTPVGPMGKVTQLSFAVLDPGNVTTNLMAANVTGGSASQAGDMMHDLKTGLLLGSSPRHQFLSQLAGVVAGALAGSAIYLVLVPDPRGMLMTAEWAAPAVAQWKAVAEIFRDGLDKLPPGATTAMLWGGLVGIVLAAAEKLMPVRLRRLVPSPSAMGIAVVIPAYISVSFFMGAVLAVALNRFFKTWSSRFLVVAASGIIAGESLTGAVQAVWTLVSGGSGGH